jgi:hypothetical protein
MIYGTIVYNNTWFMDLGPVTGSTFPTGRNIVSTGASAGGGISGGTGSAGTYVLSGSAMILSTTQPMAAGLSGNTLTLHGGTSNGTFAIGQTFSVLASAGFTRQYTITGGSGNAWTISGTAAFYGLQPFDAAQWVVD